MLYNSMLSYAGFLYYSQVEKKRLVFLKEMADYTRWPSISILIPAHNEEVVIRRTVEAMLKLDYPDHLLEIIVINDNSSDATGRILEEMQQKAGGKTLKVVTTFPPHGGKGKSNALNIGYQQSKGDFIAVYDADNTPNAMALKFLAYTILTDDSYAAVVGKFRVINKEKNILTRFINIETMSFQWLAQGGRWFLFGLATIPGTNFIIRRTILEKLGGWDTKAIAEDTEISIRIYQLGYKICFMPLGTTWEQEPETMKVWFKQRLRWVKGNLYVIHKYLPKLFQFRSFKLSLDILYFFSTYFTFLSSVLISDVIFVINTIGVLANIPELTLSLSGYFTVIWLLGYIMFILQILIVLNFEKSENNLKNVFYVLIMYFTYCQLWIILAVKGVYSYIKDRILKAEFKWDKTQRF